MYSGEKANLSILQREGGPQEDVLQSVSFNFTCTSDFTKQVHSVIQPCLSPCHLACAAAQVTSCIGGVHLVVNLQAHCLGGLVRDGIRIGEGGLNTLYELKD